MFSALQYRNYRLFFIGQTLSLIGTWMEGLAMSWLVYRITGSELWLGTVTFASQIPMFLASPYAGVVSDRLDKRKLLLATQGLFALAAGALAALVLTKTIQPWHLLVLGVFVGCVSAFDMPARQALVIKLVDDRKHLANAIAMNSTQFNVARLIGPPIAAATIASVGEGICFLINTISFLAVIGGLLQIKLAPEQNPPERKRVWHALKEGATYAWHNVPIRALLVLMMMVSFASGAYGVLLVVFAKDLYHGDAHTLGILSGAIGAGALISALYLAYRQSVLGLPFVIACASGLFSLSMALFGLTHNVWSGLPFLVVMGVGGMLHMGATNTVIQTLVDDHVRGRVMSFYAMSFVGTMPLGSLVAGILSPQIGASWVMTGAGVIGLLAVFAYYRALPTIRSAMRPVYESKGILQPKGREVVTGE